MSMSICSDVLWDESLSWKTDHPILSRCFKNVVLRALPCLILWILSPVDLLSKSKPLTVRWSVRSLFRVVLAAALCITHVIEVSLVVKDRGYDTSCLSDFWTPVIVSASYLLTASLMVQNMSKGFTRSAAIWVFMFASTVCGSLNYYQLLNSKVTHYDSEYYAGLISLPLVVTLLITCSISDKYQTIAIAGTPALRDYVSFPSFFTYTWVDKLMFTGYKRKIELHDLFGIPESCKSHHVSSLIRRNIIRKDAAGQPVAKGVGRAIFKTFKYHLLESGICRLATDTMGFVPPLMLKWLLHFVSSKDPHWNGVLIVCLLVTASFVATIAQNAFFESASTLGIRVKTSIMTNVYKKSLSISNRARKEKSVGEIVNLMAVDSDKFNMLMMMFHLSWSATFQICVAIYLLYQELGYSAFAGIAAIVIIMPFNAWISRRMKTLQTMQMKFKDERVKSMNEVLNGMKVVKLQAWEQAFMAIISKIRNSEMKLVRCLAYYYSLMSFTTSFTPTLVTLITFSVYSIASNENVLDPAKLFFSLSIFGILRMPLVNLPYLIMSFINAHVSLKRLNSFFAAPDQPQYVEHKDEEKAVTVKDALLSWSEADITSSGQSDSPAQPSSEQSRLDGPSVSAANDTSAFELNVDDFQVGEGSFVAVVGIVGSGKSSLLSCLLGEMNLLRGQVTISSNMRSTAYVSQQAWIQNLTLQNNILFGKELDQERYDQIVSMCELDPDLAILPAGDQTEIGEKGINLSGGQKQRLSLARACYSDADLYLLDDPLSAVDAHVGKKLFESVLSSETGFLKRKTRILVTNNISILPQMDKIYVMKSGCISESGCYSELMERKSAFSEFVNEHSKLHPADKMIPGARNGDKPDHEEEGKDKKGAGKKADRLVQEEKREEGRVKWNVFYTYIRSVALFPFVIIFLLLTYAADAGNKYWLSKWSEDQPMNDSGRMIVDPKLRNERLLVFGLLGLMNTLFLLCGSLLLAKAGTAAGIKFHERLMSGVFMSPMSFFETTPVGRIVNRFSQDVRSIDVYIANAFQSVMENILIMIAAILMIAISIPFFIIVIIPLIIGFFFIQRYFVATSRQVRRISSTTGSPIYSNFSETLAGIETIRAYSSSDRFIDQTNENIDKNVAVNLTSIAINRWLTLRVQAIGSIAIFSVGIFAVYSRSTLSAGLIGLCVNYAMQISLILSWFVRSASYLETEIVAVERVLEYANNPSEADWSSSFENKPPQSWPQTGDITFTDFSTRYRPELDLAVREMNLHIRSKEKVGVVGRTGAGKSTLSLSLFRLIEAASGKIVIDDVDISQIGLHDLRNNLTIIPQDPVLFSGSLRSNLDPFEKERDETLWQCLAYAHLKEFVSSLENQLEHKVEEGGKNLSVGQRQLLCLARALTKKTKILVLDEATAAVDLETDSLIQNTIREQFNDCTVITIAHRLDTIMNSDRVLIMKDGRVAEFDSPHNLLMDENSLFHSLAVDAGILGSETNK